MWYLLVAAGAGYLAQRWQNTHKTRPLLPGKCRNQKPSPPSSAPATPKISSFSSSGMNEPEAVHNADTSSNGFFDKEGTSTECKAPLSCFVSGSVEDNLPHQQVNKLTSDSPRCNSSYALVLKSNKRSACEAFLVEVPDTFKPTEVNKNDQIVPIPVPNLDFTNSEQNTRDQYASNSRPTSESANIEWTTKSQLVPTSKPSLGFTNIQRNAKDQVVYTSKANLDSVNLDNKEQLQGDSTSPSSCCSSSSTVLNSPIGRKPVLQKLGSLQFQGKERRLEINKHGELNTLQNHVAGSSSPSFLNIDALKGSGQEAASSVSNCDCSQASYPEVLQRTSPWGCEECLSNCLVRDSRSNLNAITSFSAPVFTDDKELLATSIHTPYVFTGENQRGISRTENFSNEFMCNDKVKLGTKHKESTLSIAGDAIVSRKLSSLVSSSHSVETENACEAESESLVSFGLAMAVCFMVSSSKKEMENMGKVLKETEDLVSDMRKELEKRRAQSCVTPLTLADDECNDKLLTIKSKDAVTQVEKKDTHIDSLCQVGFSDDESIRSVVTEEHAQYGFQISDLKAGHKDKPHFVETNVEGYLDSDKQNEECDFEDEKDSSTREETGEDDYVLSLLELERKLWKVFQERQEEKILELEAALERALSKLQEKEQELQWWKNRAAWLMEHSAGSTSGASSVKTWIERVEEGFSPTDTSSFLIKGCNASEKMSHKFSACNTNTPEFSAGETNFLESEEECIEIVGNMDGPKNRAEHQNQMVRVGSDCSISSSEESVLSFDVRTFRYPGYMGSIEPS